MDPRPPAESPTQPQRERGEGEKRDEKGEDRLLDRYFWFCRAAYLSESDIFHGREPLGSQPGLFSL
ncbi:hypothetical protein DESC_240043 [Desulfosarcina cetonica]|nr:hypothetical protein DESC_240043 [Desulfosarcina cetonica]